MIIRLYEKELKIISSALDNYILFLNKKNDRDNYDEFINSCDLKVLIDNYIIANCHEIMERR